VSLDVVGLHPVAPAAPRNDVDRCLIVHWTGMGKTYSMILALDTPYADPQDGHLSRTGVEK
jgi:hypothetical protein